MSTEELEASHEEMPTAWALFRRALVLLAVIAVLALAVSVLPGFGEVRDRFAQAEPRWLILVFLCALASTFSYVSAVRGTLSKRIGWRSSAVLGMAEQGSNVLLPTGGVGGPALGAVVLRRAGVPIDFAGPRSAALFLLTSATSLTAVALAGLLTGIGVLPSTVFWLGTIGPAVGAIAIVAVVAALARLEVREPAEADGRLVRLRRHVGGLVRDGVRESLALLRRGDALTIGGCIGFLGFDIAALAAGFSAFGGGGPPIGIFVLAYTLGQVGSFIPTPGGIGGTEGGLIGVLVLYGTAAAPATAAVLAYRVFQLGLPTVFGLVAFSRIRTRLQDRELVAATARQFRTQPRD